MINACVCGCQALHPAEWWLLYLQEGIIGLPLSLSTSPYVCLSVFQMLVYLFVSASLLVFLLTYVSFWMSICQFIYLSSICLSFICLFFICLSFICLFSICLSSICLFSICLPSVHLSVYPFVRLFMHPSSNLYFCLFAYLFINSKCYLTYSARSDRRIRKGFIYKPRHLYPGAPTKVWTTPLLTPLKSKLSA